MRAEGPVQRGELPVVREAKLKKGRPEAADQVGQQRSPRVSGGVAAGVHRDLNLLEAGLPEQLGDPAAEPRVGTRPAEA